MLACIAQQATARPSLEDNNTEMEDELTFERNFENSAVKNEDEVTVSDTGEEESANNGTKLMRVACNRTFLAGNIYPSNSVLDTSFHSWPKKILDRLDELISGSTVLVDLLLSNRSTFLQKKKTNVNSVW